MTPEKIRRAAEKISNNWVTTVARKAADDDIVALVEKAVADEHAIRMNLQGKLAEALHMAGESMTECNRLREELADVRDRLRDESQKHGNGGTLHNIADHIDKTLSGKENP